MSAKQHWTWDQVADRYCKPHEPRQRAYYWVILLRCHPPTFNEHSILLQSGAAQDEDFLVKIKHKVATRRLIVSQTYKDTTMGHWRLGMLRTALHTRFTEFPKYPGFCVYAMKDWKHTWYVLYSHVHKHVGGCFMDYENNQSFNPTTMQAQPVTKAIKETAQQLQDIYSAVKRLEQATVEHTKVLRRIQCEQYKMDARLIDLHQLLPSFKVRIPVYPGTTRVCQPSDYAS